MSPGLDAPQRAVSIIDSLSDIIQTPYSDQFRLSKKEETILELYDQLEELRLEQHLLEAANTDERLQDVSDDNLEAHLTIAEKESLEARAEYLLRNQITRNVLITDPVLKAVYGSDDASIAESRLLPLVRERDTLAMIESTLATKLSTASRELSTLALSNQQTSRKNTEMTRTLVALAESLKTPKPEEVQDIQLRREIQVLESQIRSRRRTWRTMKSIVSAVIVGSGVDWVEDERLMELVMGVDEAVP